MSLRQDLTWSGARLEVELDGDLDVTAAPALIRRCAAALVDRPDVIAVDLLMDDVAFIDSTGLGALVEIRRAVEDHGAELRLRGLHQRYRRLLELTRLDRGFTLDP